MKTFNWICSSYKLRIEGMLLKEEFASNMSYLEPSINSMMVAAEGNNLDNRKSLNFIETFFRFDDQ